MPATEITKDASPVNLSGGIGLDAPGDQIDYTVTVSVDEDTPGDTYSFTVNIEDSLLDLTLLSGDVNDNGLLDTGEMWVYGGSYEITQDDLDADSQIRNVVEVELSGTYDPVGPLDPRNVTLVGSESATEFLELNPAINIEKLTNGLDADDPKGPLILVDDAVNWTYVVTNAGNTALEVGPVIDDNGTPGDTSDDFAASFVGGDTDGDGKLDVNETWTYTAAGVAQEGQYSNLATVTGTAVNGEEVSDEDPSHYFGARPDIDLEKEGVYVDVGMDGLNAGDRIDYTFVIENTGNVTLDNVTLSELGFDLPGDILGGDVVIGTLAPGETYETGVVSVTLTQADVDFIAVECGGESTLDIENIAVVFGTPQIGPVVDDTDDAVVTVDCPEPDILLIKDGQYVDANGDGGVTAGDELRYTFTVTNTGAVTLTNVTVEDVVFDLGTLTIDGGPIASLAPGDTDSTTFTAVHVLDQADIDAILVDPDVDNLALARGTAPDGTEVTDDDPETIPIELEAVIDIEKLVSVDGGASFEDADSPTGPIASSGTDPVFRYLVANPGDVTLFNVVVEDDNGTPGDPTDDFSPTFLGGDTDGDGALDVDETWIYEETRPFQAGQYTNEAVVTAVDPAGSPLADDDPANYFGAVPDIDIVKTGAFNDENGDGFAQPGETISYQYSVTTGASNVPIANVVVVDDAGTPGDPTDDFNPTFDGGDTNGNGVLDLTETWLYSANVPVDAADIGGGITNIACVSGEDVLLGTPVEDCDDEFVDLPPPPPQNAGGNTPGFWKNHPAIFEAVTGFDPDTTAYVDAFDLTEGTNCFEFFSSYNLQDALEARGGGLNALARHSTAAYANAESDITDYTYVGFEGALSPVLDTIMLIDRNDDGIIDTDEVIGAVQDVCDDPNAPADDYFDSSKADINAVKDAFDFMNNVLPEIGKADLLDYYGL